MKEYLVDAVILKSTRAREADRIITLYTKQFGKKRVMAHGVEKTTSKKRGSVQPFSHSKLLLRRGRDIDTVSQGESIEIFRGLRQSLEGLAIANYLAEMADAFTPEEDPDTVIYQLLLDAFKMLNSGDRSVITRAFELKLLSRIGYCPDLDECNFCGQPVRQGKVFFLPEQGGVACELCMPLNSVGIPMSRGALESLKTLLCWDFKRLNQFKVSIDTGKEIKLALRCFAEYHLEKKMKSCKFIDLLQGCE